MKKIANYLFILAILAGITACGNNADTQSEPNAPTWQEQYDLGVRYLSEGNYEEAIIAFAAAIEIAPKRAEAYVGLANTYIQMEDYEKATETITAGQKNCGEMDMFNNILNELSQYQNQEIDNSEYLDLYGMLQSDSVVSYDDLPALFSAPFNGLEDYLPIVNDGKPMNYYYEFEESGYYSNGGVNGWDYVLDVWSCNYDFYDYLDPDRPNISSGNRVMAIAPVGDTNILDVEIRLMRESIDEVGYYGSIGLIDIAFGDSYHTVLTKLGLDANQAENYKEIGIQLYEDKEAFGWGTQEPVTYYDYPNAPIIDLTFYRSGQEQAGKHVELVFGENSRLNFVRYHNYDLLASLVQK